MKKLTYHIPSFPICEINCLGEELWVHNAQSLRIKYQFLEAIAEHVTNTYCEPIMLTLTNGHTSAGPAGVSRLWAMIHILNWTHIPAFLTTSDCLPPYVKHARLLTTTDQVCEYLQRTPKRITLDDSGLIIYNGAPQPLEAAMTMQVSDQTRQRMVELFTIERTRDGTLITDPDKIHTDWV